MIYIIFAEYSCEEGRDFPKVSKVIGKTKSKKRLQQIIQQENDVYTYEELDNITDLDL